MKLKPNEKRMRMKSEIEALPSTDFKKLCKNLEKAKKYDALKEAVIIRGEKDLEFYSLYYFPHYCQLPFSQLHRDFFESHREPIRGYRRGLGAPRGYAKSTFVSLIKPTHDLVYGLEKFIVIFSNTESQAISKLKDIRIELLENDLLIDHFNIFFNTKKVAEGSFIAHAGDYRCKFESYGTGAQIRGMRHGAIRPSKLVFDDVEHSEEVENESLRTKYESWYFSDVMKMGDGKTNVDFAGTVLHRRSLLSSILVNPIYESKKYKAIISWSQREDLWAKWKEIITNLDDDKRIENSDAFYKLNESEMLKGVEVLWPEKESYLYLMKELIETGRLAFFKEKQNEPLGAQDKVFSDYHWYREIHDERGHGILIERTGHFIPWEQYKNYRTYAVMDPATGQTKSKSGKLGDYTVIATGRVDHKGRLFVEPDWTRRAAPSKYIEAIFNLHEQYQYEKFGVETNLYRNLLLPNIVAARTELEKKLGKILKIPFYDIENSENKHKRIFTLEPKISNGWILLNRGLSQEAYSQLDEFPHADHDDFPDALEMLWGLVNNRYKMSAVGVSTVGTR